MDYTKISKLQRCNSYLENYNKIIKNTLGKISKLSWPKFITFIKEEESLYSKKILDIEKTTSYNCAKIYEILKNILYNRFNNDKQTNYVLNNPFNPVQIKRQFYSWLNNSCRLDSCFFYIFIYILGI